MAINLTNLNFFMKNYPTMEIVPEQHHWSSLYDALRGQIQKDGFYGDLAEILIQTGHPYTATAFGENVAVPLPGQLAFVKQLIPLKQVIVNAGLTMQMMDRATGGNTSWDNIVTRVLDAQRREFNWMMEICAIGDGSGRLCRVYSAGGGTTPVLTVDNTYSNWGWENTSLIKVGMQVELWKADGTQIADESSGTLVTLGTHDSFTVTAVTFGDRTNGAATTGTITLKPTPCADRTAVTTTNDLATSIIARGATVYLYGTRSKLGQTIAMDSAGTGSGTATCYKSGYIGTSGTIYTYASLPMGLTGIVSTVGTSAATHAYDDDQTGSCMNWVTFQGLTRATYPTMYSPVYRGADFDGTDETPSDWDLSVISDAMNQVNSDTGKWTDLLICSSQLALAIQRRSKAESNLQVTVSAPQPGEKALAQTAGAVYANSFLRPDGAVIPIMVSKTIPRNVLYGLCTEDLRWFTKGNFDFLRMEGDIWMKSPADRLANFEAPFGGYSQIGAERCDSSFRIEDMKDNI